MATRARIRSNVKIASMVMSALIGALLAGGGFYVVWASSVPTEGQVIELIETHSPYRLDEKLIYDKLDKLNDLDKSLHELREDVRELKVLLRQSLDGGE
jgi:hypothetical protein